MAMTEVLTLTLLYSKIEDFGWSSTLRKSCLPLLNSYKIYMLKVIKNNTSRTLRPSHQMGWAVLGSLAQRIDKAKSYYSYHH